ncbi:MAG: hypothetical protein M1837_002200 [Sclerophora amabilis]|nr:MAG: hypothetical protein M1837_002200 [Sclerophora amabilis]
MSFRNSKFTIGLGSQGTNASQFGSSFGATSTLSYISEPPNLSSISDANVVVAFKNLLKKDATTKGKALEELQGYLPVDTSDGDGVEDALLEAWIKIYPRTSIDVSRRVRQLAHSVQCKIARSSGKRVAKYMPQVVGAWLAGIYDNDRAVAKAAEDGLKLVFPSEEKMSHVWRIYQSSILEFAKDAVLKETAQTLSDERTVSPDDAEAKHARVVATGISVVGNLLSELPEESLEKASELYDELLMGNGIWNYSYHKDAFVRRCVYRLLRTCLVKQKSLISSNLTTISTTIISKSLNTTQAGSAWDYSEMLVLLTKTYPNIWTDTYTAKKPVGARLRQFLKKGAQGGPPEVWDNISRIFEDLPEAVLPPNLTDALDLLENLRYGINTKNEARANRKGAWLCYLDVTIRICTILPRTDQSNLLRDAILPVFQQHVMADSETSQFYSGNESTLVCSIVFHRVSNQLSGTNGILEEEWRRIAGLLIQEIKSSSPEQSKDFEKSQNSISTEGHRWIALNARILQDGDPFISVVMFEESSRMLLEACIKILISRNGKPYGAARILKLLLQLSPHVVWNNSESRQIFSSFLIDGVPALSTSPSAAILYSCIDLVGKTSGQSSCFSKSFNAVARSVLKMKDSPEKAEILLKFVSSIDATPLGNLSVDEELESYFLRSFEESLRGRQNSWSLVSHALSKQGSLMSSSGAGQILAKLTNSLTLEDQTSYALEGAGVIVKQNKDLVKPFIKEQPEFLSHLLFLAESPDESIGLRAEAVAASVQSSLANDGEAGVNESVIEIINQGLGHAGPNSVSIESLIELAQNLLKHSVLGSRLPKTLLPDAGQWDSALVPFLKIVPNPALAMTDRLGGAVYLVSAETGISPSPEISRDQNGFSTALRMAMFTSKLLKSRQLFESIELDEKVLLMKNLRLTLSLTNDNLGLAGANNLWNLYSEGTEAEIMDFVSDAQELTKSWLRTQDASPDEALYDFINAVQSEFERSSFGSSAPALYHARALAAVSEEYFELVGWQKSKPASLSEVLNNARKGGNIFHVIALLVGYKEPLSNTDDSNRLLNELVSELTFLDDRGAANDGLWQLVLLNALMQHQDSISKLPSQRLVPFIKTLLSWLDDVLLNSAPIASEVAKILCQVLPVIQEVYGEHWSRVLLFIREVWSRTSSGSSLDGQLPVIQGTLKLFTVMKKIHASNDDADDAWHSNEDDLFSGLLGLLRSSPSEQLLQSTFKERADHEQMLFFALLQSQSLSIQQAAFELLHRQIPAVQEQISLDVALGDRAAKLPEELLSLVLQAPTLDSLASSSWNRYMPSDLRGYLLSWVLIFDHFSNSSYKVRSDYISAIKEGGYLQDLLNFISSFLGHDRGKPIDAARFDATSYTCDIEAQPEKDTQWLLIHLYYLSLKHVPSLTKAWWIDCPRRQTRDAVENWTEKFISPLVIGDELRTVREWVDNSSDAADGEMKVKVSTRAKEVTASYEVDEQTMQIMIKLPGTYPLSQVTVEGLNRVGVDEKKWRSWLINTQGVIMFSNGSIVDGLTAWRKNVTGALKGQIECAICYSIISSDKQLPTKKCNTCKNLFHSSCLFKWFKSSNSSSCPLCRNAFNYG